MKKSLVVAACLAASVAVAAPAWATGTPYKVQIGSLSAAAGNQPFTASSSGAVTFAGLSCTSSTVPSQTTNNVTNSPTTNVTDLASLARVLFAGCTGFGGGMTITQNGTWKLHATAGVTNASTDTVTGHIDNVSAQVQNVACHYTASGKANMTYDESTKKLTLNQTSSTPNLIALNVTGCGGQVVNGQALSWTAAYTVAVSGNAVVNIKP